MLLENSFWSTTKIAVTTLVLEVVCIKATIPKAWWRSYEQFDWMLICMYLVKASINYAKCWFLFDAYYLKNHETCEIASLDLCQPFIKKLLPNVWCTAYMEFWFNVDVNNFQNAFQCSRSCEPRKMWKLKKKWNLYF